MYGSENGEEPPRFISSPQRQASPFPLESTNRRFYRRNRNSKGEEIFNGETGGGTLSRRNRRTDDFSRETNGRGSRMCQMNGPSSGAQSERECDSPPEPAPPEVPPRGPSLHVTLRHRPAPDQPTDSDRLFLSEGNDIVQFRNKATFRIRNERRELLNLICARPRRRMKCFDVAWPLPPTGAC
ncbi:unnamed protein product [Euphydryas editha]|uniref:Uncharacterized protein n=1 Tax=Euphydryas editha TaxID=104508 RepID=A0AAU9U2P9_EUPED|nr:unnamed protein product [Euphydryas editha]